MPKVRRISLTLYSKMMQTSILRYITWDRQLLIAENPKSILLRFPYHIRRKIYEYAGLSNDNFISLNYEYPDYFEGCFLDFHTRYPWLESIPPYDKEEENEKRDEVGKIYEDED